MDREIQELTDDELECLYYEIEKEREERKNIENKKISSFEEFFYKVSQNIELTYFDEKNSRKSKSSRITKSLFKKLKKIYENDQIVEFNGIYYKISIKRDHHYKRETYSVYAKAIENPVIRIS